jgi:hypothetical protein
MALLCMIKAARSIRTHIYALPMGLVEKDGCGKDYCGELLIHLKGQYSGGRRIWWERKGETSPRWINWIARIDCTLSTYLVPATVSIKGLAATVISNPSFQCWDCSKKRGRFVTRDPWRVN